MCALLTVDHLQNAYNIYDNRTETETETSALNNDGSRM